MSEGLSVAQSISRDKASRTCLLRPSWWHLCLAGLLVIVFLQAVIWIFENPSPTGWDDGLYLNQVLQDAHAFRTGGPLSMMESFVKQDPHRPPAYRLLAAPFAIFGLPDVGTLRLVSLATFAISIGLVFSIISRIASPDAGFLTVSLAVLIPSILRPNADFGTECALYLATAGVLFFLFRITIEDDRSLRSQVGLAISIGLGCAAKVTFLLLLVPMIGTTLILLARNGAWQVTGQIVLRNVLRGMLLAGPLWIANGGNFIQYARYAASYERHNMGEEWASVLLMQGIGAPATALIGLMLLCGLLARLRGRPSGLARSDWAVIVCGASGVPLLAAQAFWSNNHNLRVIGPSVLLSLVAVGVLYGNYVANRTMRGFVGMAAVLLLAVQMHTSVASSLTRIDGWDWSALHQLVKSHELSAPRIAYLGNGNQYNPPIIEHPWRKADEAVSVVWIWRYEMGDLRINEVLPKLVDFDVVLVAPGYAGLAADSQHLDNLHNYEFYERMRASHEFSEPVHLAMGRDERAEIAVFFRLVDRAHLGGAQTDAAMN